MFLVLFPVAPGLHYVHADGTWVFIASAPAIIPLAEIPGDATEPISEHVSPGVGGLLKATFGNAGLICGVIGA